MKAEIIKEKNNHAQPTVGSVMTPFTVSVALETPITQATAFMREYAIHHLPVIDENEKLTGVISARDIQLLKAIDPETPEEKLMVKDAYIDEPYMAEENTALTEVLEEMAKHHYGSTLVTQNDKLIGIFTMNDACRYFAKHLKKSQ